ncbi:hypothetical protein F0562_033157 [Nyssa sinensis]|uniref:REF/SRPP-like protein n=1 Tax=Nyssa sinensis TaxID=561372 RepID=A0A5J5ARW4_9ASTE|nr:hypothetical protein F0562_033157 [Nyssa sinensis]
MASDKIEMENSDGKLKHLEFARMIAINALVCLSDLYEYAKQNSGPLKSTVGTVESAVATVVGPVYEKFRGVPGDLLVFLDKKVDEATVKFDKHAPSLAKQVVGRGHFMVQKASQEAQTILREAQVGGPHAAIDYTSKLFKQSLLSQGVRVWYGVNQIPPFHAISKYGRSHCCLLVREVQQVNCSHGGKGLYSL